jgi:hypothetical protein
MPDTTGRRTRVGLAAFAAIAVAVAIAGCDSGASSSSTSTSTSSVVYHPLRPPSPPSRPKTHHGPVVGQTQRVHAPGTVLSVTIHQLLDPLRGSGAALPPGTRAVGLVAEIVNDGPGVYDSSSTGDFSLIPSAGTATPVFAPQGDCQTPLRDWDNEISVGESRGGCVAFAVPARARIIAARFSPHALASGRVTWSTAG